MPWLRRRQSLRRLQGLRRMQGLQRLPLRCRLRWMWRLRRWLDRRRRAIGLMRRLLCILGPLPLVLALTDWASTRRDFIGRAPERPGQFFAFVIHSPRLADQLADGGRV